MLVLDENQISDIAPLVNLTNLTALLLADNQIDDITPLSKLINLTALVLDDNQIDDITPLSYLTNLTFLWLRDNRISDIAPLVENKGLGEGDEVHLAGNPLNSEAHDVHIPALKKRGVEVDFTPG